MNFAPRWGHQENGGYYIVSPRSGFRLARTRRRLTIGLAPPAGSPPVEWLVSNGAVAYVSAPATMSARAEAITRGESHELIWLLDEQLRQLGDVGSDPPRPIVRERVCRNRST